MSDAAQVALIAGLCNVLAIFVSRWFSHREHKQNTTDIRAIRRMMNGKEEEEVL